MTSYIAFCFFLFSLVFALGKDVQQHVFQKDSAEGKKAALEIEKASHLGLLPTPRSSVSLLLAGAF